MNAPALAASLALVLALSGCTAPPAPPAPSPASPTRADMHALRLRLNAAHGLRREEWPQHAQDEWNAAFAAYLGSRP